MLRVITGKAKNKKLLVPDSARPITDRIRTSIFDTIQQFIPDAQVLDLFAGSGSFGIECLSREAKNVVFVEKDDSAINLLEKNLINTNFTKESSIFKQRVETFLLATDNAQYHNMFNLIMLDPPFPMKPESKTAIVLATIPFLADEGLLIFRFPARENYSKLETTELNLVFSKKYGISFVNYYRKA